MPGRLLGHLQLTQCIMCPARAASLEGLMGGTGAMAGNRIDIYIIEQFTRNGSLAAPLMTLPVMFSMAAQGQL